MRRRGIGPRAIRIRATTHPRRRARRRARSLTHARRGALAATRPSATPGTGRDLPPPSSSSLRNSRPRCSITAAAVRR
eukprot:2371974-Prymnesium_polylepis.1